MLFQGVYRNTARPSFDSLSTSIPCPPGYSFQPCGCSASAMPGRCPAQTRTTYRGICRGSGEVTIPWQASEKTEDEQDTVWWSSRRRCRVSDEACGVWWVTTLLIEPVHPTSLLPFARYHRRSSCRREQRSCSGIAASFPATNHMYAPSVLALVEG